MSDTNNHYAYFSITNSFDPVEITKLLGVKPTDCGKKGDIHPKTKRERQFSRWTLHSRVEKTLPLEDHVRDVLDQLDREPEALPRGIRTI